MCNIFLRTLSIKMEKIIGHFTGELDKNSAKWFNLTVDCRGTLANCMSAHNLNSDWACNIRQREESHLQQKMKCFRRHWAQGFGCFTSSLQFRCVSHLSEANAFKFDHSSSGAKERQWRARCYCRSWTRFTYVLIIIISFEKKDFRH